MPRMSITLTDQQAEALERIAAETGATKQSMISFAITDWLVKYLEKKIVVRPTEDPQTAVTDPEPTYTSMKPAKPMPQREFIIRRNGVPIMWLKGHWETASHCTLIIDSHKVSEHGEWFDMPEDEHGRKWTHDIEPDEEVIEC